MSRMAPKSHQEAEEAKEAASSSPVDIELASVHPGPPAGTLSDLVAPTCLKDRNRSSTPVLSSTPNLQSISKCLDPHTLGLLWRQRELELQALRCAIQNRQDPQHSHILQEVAGLPFERSSCSQVKLLQAQVQKLTLELKEQKKQAQLEKAQLEEQLLQTRTALQRMEAELQALQESCLLQLARSSWVGRTLRSSMGSMEVVTAEILMDPSDLSEDEEAAPSGEGFRLQDVDWNSIAHRYPNLLANIRSNLGQKHPGPQLSAELPPASPPEEGGTELCSQHKERYVKSVEWSSLPLVGTSTPGGPDSDLSSPRLHMRLSVQVTRHLPQAPGRTSEQMEGPVRSFSRGSGTEPEGLLSSDLRETHSGGLGRTILWSESGADPGPRPLGRHPSQESSRLLKIVAASPRQGFVCIRNESLEDTADLGGFTLQQLMRHFPVRMYRFPPHTLLAPGHHVTVWGEGPGGAKRQPSSSLGREPAHRHSSQDCVTLLLSPKGEVLSEHRAPHHVTPVSRFFDDSTDVSTDHCPPSEARPEGTSCEQRRQHRPARHRRVREVQAGRLGPGRVPGSPPPPQAPPHKTRPPVPQATPPGPRRASRAGPTLPRLRASGLFRPPEVPARPESAGIHTRELLLAVPQDPLGLADRQARKEHRVQVCTKSVDRGCPMVALAVQGMTKSRCGLRFLSFPPITADPRGRV